MTQIEFRQSRSVPANLDYLAKVHRVDKKKIASIMGISVTIFYSRCKDPETFRLEELERVAQWSTKRGYAVSLGQLLCPFVPTEIKRMEVSV